MNTNENDSTHATIIAAQRGEIAALKAECAHLAEKLADAADRRVVAVAGSAAAPSAVFEGYVDGMPRITWCGEALPAGTALYAAAPVAQPTDTTAGE